MTCPSSFNNLVDDNDNDDNNDSNDDNNNKNNSNNDIKNNEPIWSTLAVGVLFRRAKRIHIDQVGII